MTPIRIDNKTARALWLNTQGLATAPTGPLDLLALIKALGFVQIDSIQVVARAQHHILWSRNQNYREPMLDKLLQSRGLFEHFTHDASVLPMEYLPMWRRQFRRKKDQYSRAGWVKNLPDRPALDGLIDRIRADGALSTHAFDSKIDGEKQMWSRPPHKLGLDYLWYAGELATSRRDGFTKVYDLADRIFPTDLAHHNLADIHQIDWLCQAAITRMGFGTAGDIQRFWDAVSLKKVQSWCADANLRPVEIQSVDGSWTSALAPENIETVLADLRTPTHRLRILNPFDPAIRDRNRLMRLFGFDYRVEMFVPAAKRIWGYYVFPLLEGTRFVGRVEVKADRKTSSLNVLNVWAEPGIKWTTARHTKLEAELDRMRRFIGVNTLTGDIAPKPPTR